MKDTDLMPFGKHKGEQMANVPDSYLIWLWKENQEKDDFSKGPQVIEVLKYIEDSFNEKELNG